MKMLKKIADAYTENALIIDFIMVTIAWLASKYLDVFPFVLIDKNNQINILGNLISTDISLAGFLLAALTIIVTFKSNLKAKGIEDAENALELIFSSKHYYSIIDVFKESIIELVICAIALYLIWTLSDNCSVQTINRVNTSGIIITSMTILRSLFVLNIILGLDRHGRNDS